MSLAYFRAEPDAMPTRVFAEHYVLINLKPEPHRAENWRGGEHRDFAFRQDEAVIAEFRGVCEIIPTGRTYDRRHIRLFHVEGEKIKLFRSTSTRSPSPMRST